MGERPELPPPLPLRVRQRGGGLWALFAVALALRAIYAWFPTGPPVLP